MKSFVLILTLFFSSHQLIAQQNKSDNLGGLFKKAQSAIKGSGSSNGSLSTDEIVSGLKEALSLGAQKSTDKLSATDGFLKMPL